MSFVPGSANVTGRPDVCDHSGTKNRNHPKPLPLGRGMGGGWGGREGDLISCVNVCFLYFVLEMIQVSSPSLMSS